jgi:hypothetical protein
MTISSIRALKSFLNSYSGFTDDTIRNVIIALGYNPNRGTPEEFKELSGIFKDCSEHGADSGFSGFIYYHETIAFFKKNRQDIANHIEQTAVEMGMDIFSMVQSFGVFRNSEKPTATEIGKALWDKNQTHPDLTNLYNVFAWYALEEVSRTWYRYLEDNPAVDEELSA